MPVRLLISKHNYLDEPQTNHPKTIIKQYQAIFGPIWCCITCNEVVDKSIGAFICIHSSSNIPHHGAWRWVLRYCHLLVRQASTLQYTDRHTWKNTHSDVAVNMQSNDDLFMCSFSLVVWEIQAHCHQCPTTPPAEVVWSHKALAGPCPGP